MWPAVTVLGGISLISALVLGIAARFFSVEVDPKINRIQELLPGANCGGCGFPGCSGFAEAVAAGKAEPTGCVAGGAGVAEQIGIILGIQMEIGPRKIACIFCKGGRGNAVEKYDYVGTSDCRAADLLAGGPKACRYGCLGFGTCVTACPFGAISMGEDGLPIIDNKKCTSCGKCVSVCPRRIIQLVPEAQSFKVLCNSHDKGKKVKDVCRIGCIACQICVKNCPAYAIEMNDELAVIDSGKCISCGVCWEKCPQKIIYADERGMSLMADAK